MLSSKKCALQEILGAEIHPGRGSRPCAGGRRGLATARSVRVGDYEVAGGRLVHHDYHPFRGTRAVDLGPALYVWPDAEGFWLECPRGGFGLPGIHEMRADAWAGASFTLLRRYGPEPGRVRDVLDYVWQAWFHRTAATPFGAFEAGSRDAMKALEACAGGRCAHD